MVSLQMIDSVEAAAWVATGERLDGDLVRITPRNYATPGHLPDLSDLALHPKVFKVFTRWFLSKFGGVKGSGCECVLPPTIRDVIDPCSEISAVKEVCWLSKGEHSIKLQSYTNDFKLFNVKSPLYATGLTISFSANSTHKLDGRIALVKVLVTNSNEKLQGLETTRFLLWNCRDMAQESFLPSIKSAIELNMPDVIVLTETRVSVHMARLLLQGIHTYRIFGISRSSTEGGCVIITFTKDVYYHLKCSATATKTYIWELLPQ